MNEVSEADTRDHSKSSAVLPISCVAIVPSGHPPLASTSALCSVGAFAPSTVFSVASSVHSHLPLVSASSPVRSSSHPCVSPPASFSPAVSTPPLSSTPPVDFPRSSSARSQSPSSNPLAVSSPFPTSCYPPQTAFTNLDSVSFSHTPQAVSSTPLPVSSTSTVSPPSPQTAFPSVLFVSPCSPTFPNTPPRSYSPTLPSSHISSLQ